MEALIAEVHFLLRRIEGGASALGRTVDMRGEKNILHLVASHRDIDCAVHNTGVFSKHQVLDRTGNGDQVVIPGFEAIPRLQESKVLLDKTKILTYHYRIAAGMPSEERVVISRKPQKTHLK